jgi:hypothetical protein
MPSEDIWITCLESVLPTKQTRAYLLQKNLSSTESEQSNKRSKLNDGRRRVLQGNDTKNLDENGVISLLDIMIRPLSVYIYKRNEV